MKFVEQLNPTIQAQAIAPIDGFAFEDEETNMFDIVASIKKSSWAWVIIELSLFWRLFIHLFMCANPLAWWQTHEGQFPNVRLIIKHFFGIPKFQVETRKSLCLVGVLTTLRCFYLQLEIYLDYINYHNGKN